MQHLARTLFDGVCNGVSQIEFTAFAALALVAFDNLGFDFDCHQHQICHQQRITLQLFKRQSLNHFEQYSIADQTRLDQFGHTCAELTRRERAQHTDVAQHKLGLIEATDHIFVAVEIDTILATHAGVDLTQQRGRNKAKAHTTHKGRSHETRNVGHNSTTDTEQEGLSVGTAFDQFAMDLRHGFEGFDTLALADQDMFVLIDKASIAGRDRAVGDDDNAVSPRQKRVQIVLPTTHNDATHQLSVARKFQDTAHNYIYIYIQM